MTGRRTSPPTTPPAPDDPAREVLEANGWRIGVHPLLLDQLTRLSTAAEQEQARGPNKKLLRHVLSLMLDEIPQDPGHAKYRHGGAIDGAHREWFRGKTGNGRYRLFYRFSSSAKVIVYAWLNDEESLRTRGAKTDAYRVFAKMLADGNPPSGWDALMSAATAADTAKASGLMQEKNRKS